MTLKFNRILKIDKIHFRAKFHLAKCSGSWVIVLTEKRKKGKERKKRKREEKEKK